METARVLLEDHVGFPIYLLAVHNKARVLITIIGNAVLFAEIVQCNDVGDCIGVIPDILVQAGYCSFL